MKETRVNHVLSSYMYMYENLLFSYVYVNPSHICESQVTLICVNHKLHSHICESQFSLTYICESQVTPTYM